MFTRNKREVDTNVYQDQTGAMHFPNIYLCIPGVGNLWGGDVWEYYRNLKVYTVVPKPIDLSTITAQMSCTLRMARQNSALGEGNRCSLLKR